MGENDMTRKPETRRPRSSIRDRARRGKPLRSPDGAAGQQEKKGVQDRAARLLPLVACCCRSKTLPVPGPFTETVRLRRRGAIIGAEPCGRTLRADSAKRKRGDRKKRGVVGSGKAGGFDGRLRGRLVEIAPV